MSTLHRLLNELPMASMRQSGGQLNPQQMKLECGPIPNVMAALPNIGAALILFNATKFG